MSDVYVEMGNPGGYLSSPSSKDVENVEYYPSPRRGTATHGFGFYSQYHAFLTMATPYLKEQWTGRLYFGVMIILTLLNSGVRVVFSYLSRDFWSALSENRQEDFYLVMRNFLIALIILAPINVLYRYQRQALAIHWRGWMTERVLKLYFSNRVYYGLERSSPDADTDTDNDNTTTSGGIDNPDQRISEDVRSFTEYSLTLFLTILMAVVDLIGFSLILFSIMPALFLAIALFATFGTVMTILIGRVLVRLNFEKLQKEASFRYSLMRVREHAESIAFLHGEQAEEEIVTHRFDRVISNMHSINSAVRNLDFFTTYYTYLTWVLPILVVAPEYFAGAVELGVVQQAAASFSHVLDDLSILVTQWESLSEFSAGIDRLFSFLTAIQRLDPNRLDTSALLVGSEIEAQHESSLQPPKASGGDATEFRNQEAPTTIHLQKVSSSQMPNTTTTPDATALRITNLTLTTPNDNTKRTLVSSLNLSVQWGENLLICGASGTGKSSLLRAIAGLWNTGSGSIQRPLDHDVYFLPQKPYCALGSLRDQLLYPNKAQLDVKNDDTTFSKSQRHASLSDNDLLDILRAVDLADLPKRAAGTSRNPVQGLDTVLDWSNMLSLGEQQRLAFGRILVNRPRFVILDEGTSALDVASEGRMYALLKDMAAGRRNAGAAAQTYISVGHRSTLLAYHDTKLVLDGDRCYVEPIPSSV